MAQFNNNSCKFELIYSNKMMEDVIFFISRGFDLIFFRSNLMSILFVILLLLPYSFKDWMRILSLLGFVAIGFLFHVLVTFFNIIKLNEQAFQLVNWGTLLLLFIFGFFRLLNKERRNRLNTHTLFYVLAFVFGMFCSMKHLTIWEGDVSKGAFKFISIFGYVLGYYLSLILVAVSYFIGIYVFMKLFRFSNREWTLIASAAVLGMLISELLKIV